MSNGETRALLPKVGGARAPLPRASDVGVTADASAEKKPRSRWQVTAAGLLAPCAAALFVLVCALAVTSGRGGDAVSVRARLGTEADDFFHTQFRGENALAFSSDASAGLGLKTHRRGTEERSEKAEEDGSSNAAGLSKPAEAEASAKALDAPEKEAEAAKKPVKRAVDEEASETKKAKKKAVEKNALSSKTSTKKEHSSSSSSSEKKASEKKASEKKAHDDLLGDAVPAARAVADDVPSSTDPAPSASRRKTKEKPKILVAVISWRDGAEEVAAMERTWLGALKDANEHMDADYRVFVGEYDDANLGGKHAELRKTEHRERRGFGGDELAAALGTRGVGFRAGDAGEPKPSLGSGSGFGFGFGFGSVSSLGKSRGEKETASEEKQRRKNTRTFDSDAEIDELAEDLAEAVDAFEEERTGAAPTREWAIFSDGAAADSSADSSDADSSDDSSLGHGREEMSKREFTSRLAQAVSKAKPRPPPRRRGEGGGSGEGVEASTKSATASASKDTRAEDATLTSSDAKTTTRRDDADASANKNDATSSSSSSSEAKTPKTSPRATRRESRRRRWSFPWATRTRICPRRFWRRFSTPPTTTTTPCTKWTRTCS